MEADKERGDCHDPGAGKVLFGDFGTRWLGSRIVDPSAMARYETAHRDHPRAREGHARPRPLHQPLSSCRASTTRWIWLVLS